MTKIEFSCPPYPSNNRKWRAMRMSGGKWMPAWKVKYIEQKQYQQDVGLRILSALSTARYKRPRWKKATVKIRLYLSRKGRHDLQNYASAKWLLDALTHAGIIIDDSYDVIGRPDVDFGGIDRANPRCEVTVRRVT